MAGIEEIRFLHDTIIFEVTFDGNYAASIGYDTELNQFYVGVDKILPADSWSVFYSCDICGPIYGFDNMFVALHEKLHEMGLDGFPKDPAYVLDRLYNPPAKIIDLGMSDEEYLAMLAEQENTGR
ncbi:hypothetical protein D0962_20560 [Leptolyngbyaceae cyanobacterium CCMR0082]|uniref:Uncharacterized protein n=1 Tax=Adonisia turfae CCMR0082 TaxID=2304604 RepID=A0A6M0S9H6_9CYAN|nr:hypothetical protein [Adonisia turfae]NEZ65137.1 hypothetical protein [Adonisia turfae CCMR0082]